MLQGKELAAAIRAALDKKSEKTGRRVGPVALAQALGIKQPSASQLLNTGRMAKEKLPLLLDFFGDVVGPDHFGLPISMFEMELLCNLRRLPTAIQVEIAARVRESASRVDSVAADLTAQLAGLPEKQHAAAA